MSLSKSVCWICLKRTSLTDEHKIPKAIYKSRSFPNSSEPLSIIPHQGIGSKYSKLVLGPRSQDLCFRNSICGSCNNELTAHSDKSLIRAVNFLGDNLWQIYSAGRIDWYDCFGETWQIDSVNFIRWLAKHAGCAMLQSGIVIPENLRKFIKGERRNECMGLLISLKSQVLRILSPYTYFSEGCSLQCGSESHLSKSFDGYTSWLSIGAISFCYYVNPCLKFHSFSEIKMIQDIITVEYPDDFSVSVDQNKGLEENAIKISKQYEHFPFVSSGVDWRSGFVRHMEQNMQVFQ